jgi:hypothetical protein
MGGIINISSANIVDCESALESLRTHLERLVQLTVNYPLECQFAGYRFVFENRADIESVIANLQKKVSAFRSAA